VKAVKNETHLSRIRKCPCLICGRPGPSEAAHVRYMELLYGKRITGKSEKPDDRWTVPLCAEHHRTGKGAQHTTNEATWWRRHKIDPLIIASLLYSHSSVEDEAAMKTVALNAVTISIGLSSATDDDRHP
jgi:hypothetical protein